MFSPDPEDFDSLRLGPNMATTRAMASAGEYRGRILSEGRKSLGEGTFEYVALTDTDGDDHVVRKGLDSKFMELKYIQMSDDSRRIFFPGREHWIVEFKFRKDGSRRIECSCANWSAHSPCSHVYFIWSQLTRSSLKLLDNHPSPNGRIDARIDATGSQVIVNHQPIRPDDLLYRAGVEAVEDYVRRRTAPRNQKAEKTAFFDDYFLCFLMPQIDGISRDPSSEFHDVYLTQLGDFVAERSVLDMEFRRYFEQTFRPSVKAAVVFERVKREVERIWLALAESKLECDISDENALYDERQCKRKLEDCVAHVRNEYRALMQSQARVSRQANASVASTLIYMMRGILVRIEDLWPEMLDGLNVEHPDDFWASCFEVLAMMGHNGLGNAERNALRTLYDAARRRRAPPELLHLFTLYC